jgi:hypothetical protein
MPHLPPAHHETSKCDSPNETKIKSKTNKIVSYSNSNIIKSMTHHNQTKELITWFLNREAWCGGERGKIKFLKHSDSTMGLKAGDHEL